MPFCPQCDTKYQENISTCPDCKEDVIPSLAPTQGAERVGWYAIESVPDEVAGNILKSVLEDEGIDVYLRSHDMPAHGGIKGNAAKSEWGDILVPTNCVARARECLKTYFASIQENADTN